MWDLPSNIGPSSTRRRVATAVAVIGMIFVGSLLAGVWPRNVEVSYTVDPGVAEVAVDYLQDGEAVASARFRLPDADTTVVRHTIRLQPGEYQAQITVYESDDRGVEHERMLVVPNDGITRFNVKKATNKPE
jgi:hypothetical protein